MKLSPAVGFLFLFLACTSPRFLLDTEKTSFRALLDYNISQQRLVNSIQAGSRITVESPEFSGNFFADIIYLNQDSLLISVSGPFGIRLGTLFIGRDRFIFYNQMANQFYNGSIADFRDRRFFQFPLKLEELINIFAAREKLVAMKIEQYIVRDGMFCLKTRNGENSVEIMIDEVTGRIKKLEARDSGSVVYTREYDEFINKDNVYFPRKITMVRPAAKQAVSIYYTRLELNREVDRQRFLIDISDNAQQIDFNLY